jgi:hypothetical protein
VSIARFFKGLVIILVGIILLLNNLSILEWSVWFNLLKLWPLLLISLGISFIFRTRLSWLGPLLLLLGVIFGIGASYMGLDVPLGDKVPTEVEIIQKEMELVPSVVQKMEKEFSEQDEDTESIEIQELTEEGMIGEVSKDIEMVPLIQKADIALNYEVGSFALKYTTPLLYECQVSYRYPEFKPVESFTMLDNEAQVQIYHQPISDKMTIDPPKNQIDLKLNPDIVYNIFLETGATAIDYDLSKFKVESFTIKSGASNINLIIPRYNGSIKIDSGVAKIDIAIPEDVGAKVHLDTGLSKKDFDENFVKQKDYTYISQNYNSALYQVDIDIDSGVSKINIHYL